MLFRKKPVVIEAERYDGTNESLEKIAAMGGVREVSWRPDGLYIVTLEGTMKANICDWIIKGVKGELYPCKPDIFAATYEAV
jgi:Lon protease-like protein